MRKNTNGFSLIEVMVVLFMIGLSVAVVVLNYSGNDLDKELQKKARRFQIVFDMASDYAVLNQVQLGLRIEPEKNQYFFMFLNDEDKWRPIQGEDLFAVQEFEQEYSLELELDDLPWVQEDSLFDAGIFDEELSVSDESTEIGKEEEQEPEPPQVFIFSSGDFTPFSLIFKFEPQFGDAFPVYFRVNGEEYTPLIVEGPLDSL
ncbi:type II secretion system minor pseudopilin GspH [Planctobacterium marinum]|uniref:type II secretion system minor pseudopilin GspH n=1 Tax=Planctobacterium marinum TaxID=1631968 RepID=UPI001E4A7640|nr:type II secretion system minor pseudopilin GspH [Planctobacterium marinum]MCC2606492.1 type II secretion system minor pseudopilin GspH [Planctobacterium marinum]